MARTPATASGRSAGRPRDPQLETRAFEAAVAVYEEQGWAGFTFEAVAARSGIGKSALYRRWQTKEDLLADALQARTRDVTKVDTGSLRSDLIALGEQLLANYTAPHGLVSLRLFVEAPHHPALDQRAEPRLQAQQREARTILKRAIERGELQPDPSNVNILPTLSGGILQKVLTSRGVRRAELRRDRRRHAEELVDFILRACATWDPKAAEPSAQR